MLEEARQCLGRVSASQRAALLTDLTEARCLSGHGDARRTAFDAIDAAREAGDPVLFARAAVSLVGTPSTMLIVEPDPEGISALTEALDRLGDRDDALRARLLAGRSYAQVYAEGSLRSSPSVHGRGPRHRPPRRATGGALRCADVGVGLRAGGGRGGAALDRRRADGERRAAAGLDFHLVWGHVLRSLNVQWECGTGGGRAELAEARPTSLGPSSRCWRG